MGLLKPLGPWTAELRSGDANFDSGGNLQTQTWGVNVTETVNANDVIECDPSNTVEHFFRASSQADISTTATFRVKVNEDGVCNNDLGEAIAKAFLMLFLILIAICVCIVVVVVCVVCVCGATICYCCADKKNNTTQSAAV